MRSPGANVGGRACAYRTILTLDGGGIRGLISARILQVIEEETKSHISDLFDLIVGTSTGGIQAAFLTAPKFGQPQEPIGTARDLVDLYRVYGPEMFPRSLWQSIKSLGGLRRPKYNASNIELILGAVFGDRELKDTIKDIVVPSYDIETRKPYFFKTSKAREQSGRNHLLRNVARATSAGPTYFPPLLLDKSQWEEERYQRRVLVDGGVFANNPSMIGLSEAISAGSRTCDILLCSIGTGIHTRRLPYKSAKKWGRMLWAPPIISVMMDGMSDAANYHAEKLLARSQYLRLDIDLMEANDDLDKVTPSNLDALLREADHIVSRNWHSLQCLVSALSSRATAGRRLCTDMDCHVRDAQTCGSEG